MFQALFDFFNNLIMGLEFYSTGDTLDDISISLGTGGNVANLNMSDYLSFLLAFVSLIIIVVLCCLFVVKIIKLVGGLIR